MDPIGQQLKRVTNELKEYLETRFELFVLNISEQITLWIGEAIQQLVGFAVLGLGLLFSLIGLSFYLGDLLNNTSYGFLIVGAPILLIGLVLVIVRPKSLARNIQQQFMSEVLTAFEEKEEKKSIELKQLSETAINKEEAHV